ncbi:hypothetical protein V2I52_00505 [Brenneria sp. g21c3]|uniref:hypothetical protein n=1 Tax=Brenneria sp. g21c3 TaxID=3093893 RepID=UPI002EA7BA10|nr:hypothetical protein [Brenneria sp. g21c3]
MKVDVAVCSYKKPELLFKTLLSLKKVSEKFIDTIWICDDGGNDDSAIDFYNSDLFKNSLKPWKVNVRENTQRGGWWFTPVKGLKPTYLSFSKRIAYSIRGKIKGTGFSILRENVRYQWAIDSTDKEYLFVIHDDVDFYADVIDLMLRSLLTMEKPGIAGDLGQCWRCEYSARGCTPLKVSHGDYPSRYWPNKEPESSGTNWPCRMNEWCCILNVQTARYIEKKYDVLYGWFDNSGDTSAYWFYLLIKEGYQFSSIAEYGSNTYYLHADGGSGHSYWVDQGEGKKIYKKEIVIKEIQEKFNIKF